MVAKGEGARLVAKGVGCVWLPKMHGCNVPKWWRGVVDAERAFRRVSRGCKGGRVQQ